MTDYVIHVYRCWRVREKYNRETNEVSCFVLHVLQSATKTGNVH